MFPYIAFMCEKINNDCNNCFFVVYLFIYKVGFCIDGWKKKKTYVNIQQVPC